MSEELVGAAVDTPKEEALLACEDGFTLDTENQPDTPDMPDTPDTSGTGDEGGKETFLQAFKRNYLGGTFLSDMVTLVLAFVWAFILGAILMVLASPEIMAKAKYFFANPSDFLDDAWEKIATTYRALGVGAFGSVSALGVTTAQAAPLIAAGLGVALCFRVGLFNIGGQGQAIWGCTFAAWVGFGLHLPAAIHVPLALLAGVAGGAAWGGLAGFLRAKFGANEVIVTIMLNYVASSLLTYLLLHQLGRPGRTDPISPVVDDSAMLPYIPGTRFHLGFLLVIVAGIAVWWLLDHTKLGFAIRAVGGNPHAAAAAGMSMPFTLTMAMVIGGALCGLAGAQLTLSPNALGRPDALTPLLVGTIGFDAITVALLGRSKPLGTVLAGLLFGALKAGALRMQGEAQTPGELASVIQAFIVMFVAAPALVRTITPFLSARRKPKKKAAVVGETTPVSVVAEVSAA
ncbi:MAG: ABC transporter permease [Propionibacteriaceae bacterium]|jgi:simple sugar transport system permease protein|nr:ABC transporter permease [Propionibacteriaceae bacterium]